MLGELFLKPSPVGREDPRLCLSMNWIFYGPVHCSLARSCCLMWRNRAWFKYLFSSKSGSILPSIFNLICLGLVPGQIYSPYLIIMS